MPTANFALQLRCRTAHRQMMSTYLLPRSNSTNISHSHSQSMMPLKTAGRKYSGSYMANGLTTKNSFTWVASPQQAIIQKTRFVWPTVAETTAASDSEKLFGQPCAIFMMASRTAPGCRNHPLQAFTLHGRNCVSCSISDVLSIFIMWTKQNMRKRIPNRLVWDILTIMKRQSRNSDVKWKC